MKPKKKRTGKTADKILFSIAVLAIILAAAAIIMDTPRESPPVQIANPASVYCIEHGGKLRIVDTPEGQYGICTLPNGTECGEWKYFRGEC